MSDALRPDVNELREKKDVEGLIGALSYKRGWHVRMTAAESLGEIKDPRAVDPLIRALRDEDSGVRWSAAAALGEIKDPRA
ncbi:MAG: HEAT repeat domain-containing protein, partial [Methermicoccaceae archaeon]